MTFGQAAERHAYQILNALKHRQKALTKAIEDGKRSLTEPGPANLQQGLENMVEQCEYILADVNRAFEDLDRAYQGAR